MDEGRNLLPGQQQEHEQQQEEQQQQEQEQQQQQEEQQQQEQEQQQQEQEEQEQQEQQQEQEQQQQEQEEEQQQQEQEQQQQEQEEEQQQQEQEEQQQQQEQEQQQQEQEQQQQEQEQQQQEQEQQQQEQEQQQQEQEQEQQQQEQKDQQQQQQEQNQNQQQQQAQQQQLQQQQHQRNIGAFRPFCSIVPIKPPLPPSQPDSGLSSDVALFEVISLDTTFCKEANEEEHKTKGFGSTEIVLRRGQTFKIKIAANRTFEPKYDVLNIVFKSKNVKKSDVTNGTAGLVVIPGPVMQSHEVSMWAGDIIQENENTIILSISSPPTIAIGTWIFEFHSKIKGHSDAAWKKFEAAPELWILFNPWFEGDQVYYEDIDHLQDYVLNDVALTWSGSSSKPKEHLYPVGQYDPHVLKRALAILSDTQKQCSSPVHVLRSLACAIRADGGKGILNPGPGFESIISFERPSDALKYEYLNVKSRNTSFYAQLMNTLCRSVGIPSRIGVAFDANVLCNASVASVTCFYDMEMNSVKKIGHSRRYHEFCEVWLGRYDVPGSDLYFDWHFMDCSSLASPKNVVRLGPAPRGAVKEAMFDWKYNTDSVCAMLNTTKVVKISNNNDELENVFFGGAVIITKSPNKFSKLDITDHYRHEIDSKSFVAVRAKLFERFLLSPFQYGLYNFAESLDIAIKSPERELSFAGDIDINVLIINNFSKDEQKCTVIVCLKSLACSGYEELIVKRETQEWIVKPASNMVHTMTVSSSEICSNMWPNGHFIVSAILISEKRKIYREADYNIEPPEITVSIDNRPSSEDSPRKHIAKFQNVTNVTLTECKFIIFGTGMSSALILEKDPVEPITGATNVLFNYDFDQPSYAFSVKFITKEFGLLEKVISK